MLASLRRPFCFVWIKHYSLRRLVNNAQLLRDSEPIRLLETPRLLSEYILIVNSPQKPGGE